jgi:hypothetical protein
MCLLLAGYHFCCHLPRQWVVLASLAAGLFYRDFAGFVWMWTSSMRIDLSTNTFFYDEIIVMMAKV